MTSVDQAKGKRMKWAFSLAAVCAIGVFLVLQILLPCGVLQKLVPGMPEISNLPAYVLTLVLFVAAFCIFLLVFRHVSMEGTVAFMEHPMTDKAYKTAFVAGSAVLLLLLAVRRLFIEKTEYAALSLAQSFHMFPIWLAIPVFLAVAGTALFLSRKLRKDWDISRKLLFACTAGILLLNAVTVLVLNFYNGDLHHGVAYLESVYNVYYGVPYNRITMGIYGFYGLLLAPVLHLFGGSVLPLMVTMALLECLVAALCVYCVWSLVEENWFRVLALLMCCLSTISMRPRNYWQVQPHRVLWPLILVAFLLYLLKKDAWKKRDTLLGYCLCTVAVVWNVESGMFCGIAFAAACMVRDWQRRVWYSPKSLLKLLLHICCVIAIVAAAILIVNGYNYLCGQREWFLKDFFFPMFESSYVSGSLEVDMPVGNHAWVYVLVLFGALLLCALYMTSFVCDKPDAATAEAKLAPAMMAVAMLGLCNFSYYANRAAYRNLDIILQLAGIATCMLWRGVRSNLFQRSGTREDCVKTIISYVSTVLVITLSIEAVLFSAPLLLRKLMYQHYDTRGYKQACMQLQETIPENTFAFGGGIAMMYAELGWDPVGHYRDASDYRVGGGEPIGVIVKDAVQQESFAVYLLTGREEEVLERILTEEPDFRLEKEVELNGKTLQYYIRAGK